MGIRLLPLLAVLLTALFFSTSSAVSKQLLDSLDPFSIAFLRFGTAAVLFTPLAIRQFKKIGPGKIVRALPVLLLSAGNIFFFYLGIGKTTANMSVILYTLSPLFTTVISVLLLGERVSRKTSAGILIGLGGALYTLLLPAVRVSPVLGSLPGNLLILAAVISWTFYTLGSRKLMNEGFPVKAMTGLSLIVNALVFLFLSFATGELAALPVRLTLPLFLQTVYLGVFVSIVTFVLYQWTIKHASAIVASLTLYLQPLFGFLVNFVLLGESLTADVIVGGLVILAGVILATSQTSEKKKVAYHQGKLKTARV